MKRKYIDNIYKKNDIIVKSGLIKKGRNSNKKYLIYIAIFLLLSIFVFYISKKAQIKNIFLLLNYFKNGNHLVIFQNNAELRPTGGFIGSYMTFETNYFIPKNIKIETNIYKNDDKYTYSNETSFDDKVLDALSKGTAQMRDSNWWVDYRDSAQKIIFFYKEQNNNANLDTVTAINSELFANILTIIGPINMPKYNILVDNNNFNEQVQDYIENKYYLDKDNQVIHEPKSILSEMYPIVLARAKESKYWKKLYNLFFESLKNKNIILYTNDDKIEKNILKNNWGGAISDTEDNYMQINHANVGSNKSSRYVYENIIYQINNDILTLTIERIYNDQGKSSYESDPMDNINFTRIYLPKNTQLIKALDDDKEITNSIDQEFEYKFNVFRVWTSVKKNHSKKYIFIFSINENIIKNNSNLLIQKQPGAINQLIKVEQNNKILHNDSFDNDLFFTKLD